MSQAAVRVPTSPPDGPAMPGAVTVLLFDESRADAEAVMAALAELERRVVTRTVDSEGAFEQELGATLFDVILADGLEATTALELARRLQPDVPFIYLATPATEARALEALRLGATDYVLKTRLERLVPSVRRALREAEEARARRRAEERLRLIVGLAAEAGGGAEDALRRLEAAAVPVVADGCRIELLPPGSAEMVEVERSPTRLTVPIGARGRLLGALTLTSEAPRFGEEDVELATALAGMAAATIDGGRHLADSRDAALRLEAIVEQLPAGVIIAEAPSGRVSYANRRAEAIFGGPVGDVAGTPHAPEGSYPLAQALGGEVVSGQELAVARLDDGKDMVVRINAAPLRDAAGEVVGAVSVYEDVTELKKAERARDEFLAVLSHELRTPLNAVIGWTRLLRAGKVDEAQHGRAAQVIERNARMLTRMVEDLLDISAIVAGRLEIERRVVDLRRVVRQAHDSVRGSVAAKQLRLELDLDGDARMTLLGDPARLEQLVWNLLANAVKFTPPRGTIEVILRASQGHARLTVRDSGLGIRADLLPHVFERFRLAEPPLTRAHRGLGLGLSIVHHIAELHGGSVRAESDGPQRGSAFHVVLPLHDLAAEPSAPVRHTTVPPATSLVGTVILVVEDDADARDLLSAVLAMHGARVVAAADAAEALAAAGDPSISVIVSDIAMPGRDGYDLMRDLRRRGIRAPAVALTAFVGDEARLRALAAGYQAHLPKPFDPLELLGLLGDLTRGAP